MVKSEQSEETVIMATFRRDRTRGLKLGITRYTQVVSMFRYPTFHVSRFERYISAIF